MKRRKSTILSLLLFALPFFLLAGCAKEVKKEVIAEKKKKTEESNLVIDKERKELRLTAIVQKNKGVPQVEDWGTKIGPAFIGARGGSKEFDFIFVTDASVKDVYDGLKELGTAIRVVYPKAKMQEHKGLTEKTGPDDYLQGDPIQVIIRWEENGSQKEMALEDFFLEKVKVAGGEATKPWTPHFVFQGSGVINNFDTGCIVCPGDCPGSIIANNDLPILEPAPTLKADWTKLPKPGSKVIVVLRPVTSER